MCKGASDEMVNILSTQPVTSNFHKYCVTEEDLMNSRIDDKERYFYKNGLEFISAIEHKKYRYN